MLIKLYTLPNCASCKQVKTLLNEKSINFIEQKLDARGLTELRMDGVFLIIAPVLKVDSDYYTELDDILKVIAKL